LRQLWRLGASSFVLVGRRLEAIHGRGGHWIISAACALRFRRAAFVVRRAPVPFHARVGWRELGWLDGGFVRVRGERHLSRAH